MRTMKWTVLLLTGAGLSGCWTFNESPYPTASLVQAPNGKTVSVAAVGFEATALATTSIHGYDSVWVPGHYGRHHRHYGHYRTVQSTVFVEQPYATDVYLKRARSILEDAGYIVGATTPRWTVEVVFAGPYTDDGDLSLEALWMVGTVFFCDYSATTWRATMRVRDNRTGQLVLKRDYDQRYETNVFGLIPLLGISSCSKTSYSYIQGWCLSALVDRALADATDFMSKNE